MKRNWPVLILRLLIGGVFIWAAIPKILDAGALAQTMVQFDLLPSILIVPASYFLPWVELLAGLCLITGVGLRAGAVWANLLLLIFIAALSSNLIRGIEVDCGCFGSSPAGTGTKEALIRDLVILPFSLALLWGVLKGGRPGRRYEFD